MSRLQAIADMLGVSQDSARAFLRQVRAHFDEAPGYAQVIGAIHAFRGRRPTVEEVVRAVKERQASRDRLRAESERPQRGRRAGPNAASGGRRQGPGRRRPPQGRSGR